MISTTAPEETPVGDVHWLNIEAQQGALISPMAIGVWRKTQTPPQSKLGCSHHASLAIHQALTFSTARWPQYPQQAEQANMQGRLRSSECNSWRGKVRQTHRNVLGSAKHCTFVPLNLYLHVAPLTAPWNGVVQSGYSPSWKYTTKIREVRI